MFCCLFPDARTGWVLQLWFIYCASSQIGPISLLSKLMSERFDLNLTFQINLTADGSEVKAIPLSECLEFMLQLRQPTMNSTLELVLNKSMLSAMDGHRLVGNASEVAECFVTAVDQFNVTELTVAMDTNLLEFSAVSGGSLEQDVDLALNEFLQLFTDAYKPVIPAFLNAFVSAPIRAATNAAVADILANDSCSAGYGPSEGPDNSPDWEWTYRAFAIAGSVALLGSVAICKIQCRFDDLLDAGGKYSRVALSVQDDDYIDSDQPKPHSDPDDGLPLVMNPRIHFLARHGIFLLLCMNVAFFVSANTTWGARVVSEVTIGDEMISIPKPLFTFSLVNSVRDFWNAKVRRQPAM